MTKIWRQQQQNYRQDLEDLKLEGGVVGEEEEGGEVEVEVEEQAGEGVEDEVEAEAEAEALFELVKAAR